MEEDQAKYLETPSKSDCSDLIVIENVQKELESISNILDKSHSKCK